MFTNSEFFCETDLEEGEMPQKSISKSATAEISFEKSNLLKCISEILTQIISESETKININKGKNKIIN